ncbi:MAG: zinc ribbon domain-containing protein [Pirellulaceae bacterium]
MTVEIVPCPHCGGDIRQDATFCHHCGSSESDGWQDEESGYGEDSYDEDFDYNEFVRDEFPDDGVSHALTNKHTKPMWRLVAVVLLLLSLLGFALF